VPECLTSASGVWRSRWADDTNRLEKTIRYCRRAREYQKREVNNISKWLEVLVCSLKGFRV